MKIRISIVAILLATGSTADAGFRDFGTNKEVDLTGRLQKHIKVVPSTGNSAQNETPAVRSDNDSRTTATENIRFERFQKPNLPSVKSDVKGIGIVKTRKRRFEEPKFDLKQKPRAEIIRFLRKAVAIKIPDRKINTQRAKNLTNKWSHLLKPVEPAKNIHTKMKIEVEKVPRIRVLPDDDWFDYQFERIALIHDFMTKTYHAALPGMWRMSMQKKMPKNLRARDAMITGMIARARGFEGLAVTAYSRAIDLGIAKDRDDFQRFLLDIRQLKNPDFVHFLAEKTPAIAWLHLDDSSELNTLYYQRAKNYIVQNTEFSQRLQSKIDQDSLVAKKLQLLISLHQAQLAKPEVAISQLQKLAESGDYEIRNNARLTLARIYTLKRDHKSALEEYRQVSLNRSTKLDIMLERAFTEFNLGRFNDSLGKTIGLHSDFFRYSFSPESYLLEAYNRRKLCDFGGAENALANLSTEYKKEFLLMKEVINQKNQSQDDYFLFNTLLSSYDKKNRSRFQSYLLALPSVNNAQRLIYGLASEVPKLREIFHYKKYPNKAFENLVASHEHFYKSQKLKLLPKVEQEIVSEIVYLGKKLKAIFNQRELLLVDIATDASSEHSIQNALNFSIDALADEEEERELERFQQRWPYEREIWEDELAYLSVSTPSRCVNRKKIIQTTMNE